MPNITQFKTALADGGARPNQFQLNIPFPGETKDGNPSQTCLLYTSPSPRDP